jgi:hypothetical protein
VSELIQGFSVVCAINGYFLEQPSKAGPLADSLGFAFLVLETSPNSSSSPSVRKGVATSQTGRISRQQGSKSKSNQGTNNSYGVGPASPNQ